MKAIIETTLQSLKEEQVRLFQEAENLGERIAEILRDMEIEKQQMLAEANVIAFKIEAMEELLVSIANAEAANIWRSVATKKSIVMPKRKCPV